VCVCVRVCVCECVCVSARACVCACISYTVYVYMCVRARLIRRDRVGQCNKSADERVAWGEVARGEAALEG